MDDPTVNLSDEDEEMDQQNVSTGYEGSLSKWTNYIHGWQSRWMVLSNGMFFWKITFNTVHFLKI